MEESKQGIFSSLSPRKTSKVTKPGGEMAHPLLAASNSSLNLLTVEHVLQAESTNPAPHTSQKASGSWSKGGSDLMAGLPYKPRQRHGSGMGSVSSPNSFLGSMGVSPPELRPTQSTESLASFVATSNNVSAPIMSTSTSATFALPSTHADATVQANESAVPSTSKSSLSGPSVLTSRLQLQSLKATAQGINLGNGSMGMSMIDAIFEKGQLGRTKAGEGGDWGDVLRILMGGKTVLLMPTTPFSSLPMTPPTLRDHIAFVSPPISMTPFVHQSESETNDEGQSEESAEAISVLVTLSGLMGTIRGTRVTIESTIPLDCPILQALRNEMSRQSVLASLRPTQIGSTNFPSFTISHEAAILSFPPPSKHLSPTESETKEKDRAPSGKRGRMNPFASLFGSGSSHSNPSSDLKILASPSSMRPESLPFDTGLSPPRSRPSSPGPSSPELLTFNIVPDTAAKGHQVIAYTISRPIRYNEIHKSLSKSIRVHVKEALISLPEKVIDRVQKLALANTCSAGHLTNEDLLKAHKSHGSDPDSASLLDLSDPNATGEQLQDFIESIYDDLIAQYRQEADAGLRRKGSGSTWARGHPQSEREGEDEEEKDKKRKERREMDESIEREASDGTERVEGLLCRLLYNKLFSPLESDDVRHDEALASRIAALNMLDLSLDHLGLITQPEGEETKGVMANALNRIVEDVGQELQKLSKMDCLTPREKTNVLIKAHKIVVDGLASLPEIQLRPEGESYHKPREPSPISAISSTNPTVPEPQVPTPPTISKSTEPVLSPKTTRLNRTNLAKNASDGPDPLSAEDIERTPHAFTINPSLIKSPSVPQLVLDDATKNTESKKLHETLDHSIIHMTDPFIRQTSSPSQDSTLAPPNTCPKPKSNKQSTSGADLILPIIIFAVVKSNPYQLASQLMYLRRYRSAICLTGEANYAIVNLTAVVEFLEHVNLSELGLGGDSNKVMSIENLSPIGLNYIDGGNEDTVSIASASSRLRGRVGEFAGSAAGSANKVISGVVDTSLSALRGLISNNLPSSGEDIHEETIRDRPDMRPRQVSSFSLASVTASVASIAAAAAARNRSRANSRASEQVWSGNRELVEVNSRPGSIKERGSEYLSSEDEKDEDGKNDDRREKEWKQTKAEGETSTGVRVEGKDDMQKQERFSLSDRLASIGVLGRLNSPSNAHSSAEASPAVGELSSKTSFLQNLTTTRSVSTSQNHTRRSSLLGGRNDLHITKTNSPQGSIISLPHSIAMEKATPPIEKFMTCELEDIRLSEISELLRDYRRLGAIINSLNAQSPSIL
ncbi:hypothetical protein L204_105120 [Cryptococcus depauperatus]|nr:hypothetical protein L204_03769 [Cryptococcus depauperatus CBS 7855]